MANKMRYALAVALIITASTANAWDAGVPNDADLARAKAAIEKSASKGYAMIPENARRMGILPPIEYDKPYTGKLTITRGTKFIMDNACPKTTLPITLGCSRQIEGECWIVIANDDILKASGWSYDVVYRHERAHCLAWLLPKTAR
jgi:hypothetical protein